MGQCARQHHADDFHVPVGMGGKASARRNAVFVDDAQVAIAHEARVVVARKRKAVKRPQPAVVGIASILGFAQCQHGVLLLKGL